MTNLSSIQGALASRAEACYAGTVVAAWRQHGPYQWRPVPRLCPRCRARLVMAGVLQVREASGLMGRLGVACHCVHCNTKYRAQGRGAVIPVVWWVAPALARWIWWAAAEVTPVTTWTAESNFVDR